MEKKTEQGYSLPTLNIDSDLKMDELQQVKWQRDLLAEALARNENINGVGRPKNEIERKRIATYIDHRLNKKLRVYAAKEGIGLNQVLELALSEFFKID